jgi:hypothetical protein
MGDMMTRLTCGLALAAIRAGCGGLNVREDAGGAAFHDCEKCSSSAALEELLPGGRVNYRTLEGLEFSSMKACMERRGYDCDLGVTIGARPNTHCYPRTS